MKQVSWLIMVAHLVMGIGHCCWAAKGMPIDTTWTTIICKDFLIALLAFDCAINDLKD